MSEAVPTQDGSPLPADVLDSPEAGAKAIRGVALRTALFGAGLILNLLSVPFMIRHLGAVAYGYYITVSSIVFIIGALTEAGLTNLGVRYYSTTHGPEREALLRNLVGIRLTITAVGLGLATGVVALLGSPPLVTAGVLVYGLGLVISLIAYTYAIPLTAGLRLGATSGLDFMRQGLLAVATVGLVLAGAGLMPFFVLYPVVAAIVAVATATLVRSQISLRPEFDMRRWRSVVTEAASYSIAAAVGLIYFRVAAILLQYVSTDLQAGYYAAPFRVVETATTIPWMFASSVFPILARAARDDRDRLGYALQRLLVMGLIVGLGMTLVLVVGARPIIGIIAGPGFGPSVGVLQLQALALVSTFVVSAWSLALLSLHQHRVLLMANLVAVVIACGVTVALAPSLGAKGGALAITLTETALAAIYVVCLRRAHPEIRLDLSFLPRLAICLALGAAAALVPLPDVIRAVLAGAVFSGALIVLRVVPEELWSALRAGVRRSG